MENEWDFFDTTKDIDEYLEEENFQAMINEAEKDELKLILEQALYIRDILDVVAKKTEAAINDAD